MIKIFNTLSRQKEFFKPINSNNIDIYVCGITAYDLCHLGHARTFMVFDVVIRYLRYCGYKVNYIRNITDIEDKILYRAKKNNESFKNLTERIIYETHYDLDKLNIIRPNSEPRATHYIDIIIKLIKKLINKGHTYVASNGDIMFAVNTASNYGILSKKNLKELKINTRIKTVNIKRNSIDFVLWKIINETNESTWPSPWGNGRPGWHIECSAINNHKIGNHFDIHGGGSDLIFPHHENEIAQSTCAYNGQFVNFWMHTGMVMIDNKKLSKSLDNFFTVRNILKIYNSETIRFFLLSKHYRNQLYYNEDKLKQSHIALKRLYIALYGTTYTTNLAGGEGFITQFINAMNDDFNIPKAYSILFNIAHKINVFKVNKLMTEANNMAATLRHLGGLLGLLKQDPFIFLHYKNDIITNDSNKNKIINSLIINRNNARQLHQWKIADEIKNKLIKMGVTLEDKSLYTTIWYYD